MSRVKKHRPERSCIGCGRKRPKIELIRFVCDNEGNVRPDIQQKLGGRGVYLCFNEKCLKAATRGNKFSRAFRKKVETFEKCSILSKLKEGENFNRRNTLSILRTKI